MKGANHITGNHSTCAQNLAKIISLGDLDTGGELKYEGSCKFQW
jgi:hypothetical protein